MRKLRLLLFEECHRDCEGCCNKQWDLRALPVLASFEGYDEILLTGGEPMLKPWKTIEVIARARQENPTARIYVYTALTCPILHQVLDLADGVTYTLHDQIQVQEFRRFIQALTVWRTESKSLRLNVFKDVEVTSWTLQCWETFGWKIKKDIEWLNPCPLPEGETLMRLEPPK